MRFTVVPTTAKRFSCRWDADRLRADRGLLDLEQELGVALGLLHPLHEDFEGLLRLQGMQHAAELPDDLQLLRGHQDLLLAGTGGIHVDGREDPLVREFAAEPEFHVAGALELLEDDLVRPRSGLDEGRRQDGQRATVLDVAGRAEEPLRRVQGGGVHAAGHDPAAGRRGQVVRAPQAGDRVEQHDYVVAHLHQALRPLDGQFRDRGVVLGGPVEGGVDDLALDRTLHVGDLLRPLVHEDDHEVALRVVLGDRVRDGLQDHRLARLRRRHDETALALADRAHQVHDPGGHHRGIGLQAEPVLRVERHQLGEVGPPTGLLGVQAVDLVEADQRVELLPALAVPWLAHRALDHVPLAQAVPADLGERHVHVVGSGQVPGGADEPVVVQDIQDAGDRDEHVILGDHGLGLPCRAPLAASPVAVAEPVPVPAAPRVVVIAAAVGSLPAAVALAAITLAGRITLPATVARPAVALPAVTLVVALLASIAPTVLVVPPAIAASLLAALALATLLALATGRVRAAGALARRGPVRPDLRADGRPVKTELAPLATAGTLAGLTCLRCDARLAPLCFLGVGRVSAAQAGLW